LLIHLAIAEARGQQPGASPLTPVTLTITCMAEIDDVFGFSDNYGQIRTVGGSNTTSTFSILWGNYKVGDSLIIKCIAGPRPCVFTTNSAVVVTATPLTIQCDCRPQAIPSAEYKVGVSWSSSLFSSMEKFVFKLNQETIELNAANRTVYFTQKLKPGETYSIAQLSGPRACNLQPVTGTITNSDVLVSASCGQAPLTIYKANFRGIENGESFSFADGHGRTMTIPFSATNRNLGGYPVGDSFTYKQTGGPRPCIITPGSAIVTATPITVDCDCRKKPANNPPTAPTEKFDLVTRSSDNKVFNTYYESGSPVIGGKEENEGRYVAFMMYGKGVDGSTGNFRQIFWRDRKEGITKLVSKNGGGEEGNSNSAAPSISADGRHVVFETAATNLSANDKNTYLRDVFLWDQQSGQLTLISKTADGSTGNGESYEPVISGDGNTIAYTSNASDIIQLEPVFNTPNIYVHNVSSGRTEFITKDYETGKAGSGYSPSISEDGSKIAFCAYSYRLVKADNNNLWDIFLWQRGVPGLKRISMTATGGERNQGDESSSRVVWPSISGDGNNIVFATTSSNIVGGDNNSLQDIFLYNISSGGIKRVSTANGITEADGDSPVGQGERIGISYDGTWISYNTNAANMGVPKGNIVKQNTQTGEIIPVTSLTIGSTARPMISAEGRYVVAGCSEAYDKRFNTSGIFVFFTPDSNQ